jgi:aldehyde dehydrogenase (NAD+)
METKVNLAFFEKLGIEKTNYGSSSGTKWNKTTSEKELKIISPTNGELIASVYQASEEDYEKIITTAQDAFQYWMKVPAPKRGEVVRQIGVKLRDYKNDLGTLVSYEMGKSLQEGMGEVQEMIDICDFAVGQSRQLYGFTMQSERVNHRMYDQYHPLGIVATISAFNFPVAVWSWNAMIAAVCGNVNLWKPSSKVPLSAIACQNIIGNVLKENDLPKGIFSLVIGRGSTIGERMLNDKRIPLLSITGSIKAGQRCTTTRRLIIHESIYEKVKEALIAAYKGLKIGDPLDEKNHVGPLIDKDAVADFVNALERVKKEGGKLIYGGEILEGKNYETGTYVVPALVEAENHYSIVQEETFAPILYLIKYKGEVGNAIKIQNDVVQGLSSSIFTLNLREAEEFLSASGSDCGIANVNIGTSGAEIGGAFGGEKETGGGRESGSDAWKTYMRRQTNTINYGTDLPLAQGIKFEI